MNDMQSWLRRDPTGRYAVARVRIAELQQEAALARTARTGRAAAPADTGRRSALRVRIGRVWIRVGLAISGESVPTQARVLSGDR